MRKIIPTLKELTAYSEATQQKFKCSEEKEQAGTPKAPE